MSTQIHKMYQYFHHYNQMKVNGEIYKKTYYLIEGNPT